MSQPSTVGRSARSLSKYAATSRERAVCGAPGRRHGNAESGWYRGITHRRVPDGLVVTVVTDTSRPEPASSTCNRKPSVGGIRVARARRESGCSRIVQTPDRENFLGPGQVQSMRRSNRERAARCEGAGLEGLP